MVEDPGDLPVEKTRRGDAVKKDSEKGVLIGGETEADRKRLQPSNLTTSRQNNRRRARQQNLLQQHMTEYDESSLENDESSKDSYMVPGAHRIGGRTGSSLVSESVATHSVFAGAGDLNESTKFTPASAATVEAQLATGISELEGENRRLAQELADITEAEVVHVERTETARCYLQKKKVRLMLVLAFVFFGVVFAVSLGVSTSLRGASQKEDQPLSNDSSSAATTNQGSDQVGEFLDESASSRPTDSPSSTPTTGAPTHTPSSNPTNLPTCDIVSYSPSDIAPPGDPNFDHFIDFGYGPDDESNIRNISQIRIYTTVVCVTNNDCSLPTATVISLVTTYVLRDCSTSVKTNGAYTDGGRTPAGIVTLRSDQYINRIELFSERWITHIKICTTGGECFGPFGTNLEEEPNTIFEEPGSVIKALFGFSGSWLDRIGVHFEQDLCRDSSNTC